MNSFALVRRSARHYWRQHVGVVLGCAVTAMILVGAMSVGESVRGTLREQALTRIGAIDAAMTVQERTFREALADPIATAVDGRVAPVLHLPGVLSNGGKTVRTGIVDVVGADQRFFAMARDPARVPGTLGPKQAWLSRALAQHLDVAVGDKLVVRVETPSAMPRDMVMSTVEDVSTAVRVEVAAILDDQAFGRFGLRASQLAPFDVFVDLDFLQAELELEGRVNEVLLDGSGEDSNEDLEQLVAAANRAVRASWAFEDIELKRIDRGEVFEFRSDRIFMDPVVVEVLAAAEPTLLGVLTYFVNGISFGGETTPYSMVAGVGAIGGEGTPSPVAALVDGLADDQIVLNSWIVERLKAGPGDELSTAFWLLDESQRLIEGTATLKVARSVPLEGVAADPGLMPDFPGLHDAEDCSDWEPGVPVVLDRLSEEDRAYWQDRKGTPKGFMTLAGARKLWSNRFGDTTSVRGPLADAERITKELREALDPSRVGLFFRDVRSSALAAADPATDFGGLFLALSFFLIVAALLLTAMVFSFGVEQRAREIGTLLAVGFKPGKVRRLFLTEATILALLGAVLGAGLGVVYASYVLDALQSVWRGAIGETKITMHASATSVAGGAFFAFEMAVLSITWRLWKSFRAPAIQLLGVRSGVASAPPDARLVWTKRVAVLSLIAGIGMAATAGGSAMERAGAFFGAGSMVLIAGVLAVRIWLGARGRVDSGLRSAASLGTRNAARRPGRSIAAVALLAAGAFQVAAVQAFRLSAPPDPSDRSSGTGGYQFQARTTLPVLRDLRTPAGMEAYGFYEEDLEGAELLPLRVREGDDASCLNLSKPQNPRLLGVDSAALVERQAFSFAGVLDDGAADSPWSQLAADLGPDVVPAIGDAASVTWTLHKALGDDLEYTDESGRTFQVRIVGTVDNSILQGNLIIDEAHFRERFPGTSGYRMFLIDVSSERSEAVTKALNEVLEDVGFEMTPTAERLVAFQTVQNTYLLIFQALGGLGLVLGSLGLGIVLLRNALERRSELAVLRAVGFRSGQVRRMLAVEFGALLALGLVIGLVAALVAVVPGGQATSYDAMFLLVGAVAVLGGLGVALAAAFASRGDVLGSLRSE